HADRARAAAAAHERRARRDDSGGSGRGAPPLELKPTPAPFHLLEASAMVFHLALAGVWGGLLALERRAFLQAMFSRPLVAAVGAGMLLEDASSGLFVRSEEH